MAESASHRVGHVVGAIELRHQQRTRLGVVDLGEVAEACVTQRPRARLACVGRVRCIDLQLVVGRCEGALELVGEMAPQREARGVDRIRINRAFGGLDQDHFGRQCQRFGHQCRITARCEG